MQLHRLRRQLQAQPVAAGIDQRAHGFNRRVDDRGQPDIVAAQGHRAAGDAGDVQQIVQQRGQVLHLALDHLVAPALLHLGDVRSLAKHRGLADRRQRVAQLMRRRGQKLVPAPIGVTQQLFVALAVGDAGEPHGHFVMQRRSDALHPACAPVQPQVDLELPCPALLDHVDVGLQVAAGAGAGLQAAPHRLVDQAVRRPAQRQGRGAVDIAPGEVGDRALRVVHRRQHGEGPADDSSTAWKRSLVAASSACARARSMTRTALRAQMSASRHSGSVGWRGWPSKTAMVPSHVPPRLISGVQCTARQPSLRASARQRSTAGAVSVSSTTTRLPSCRAGARAASASGAAVAAIAASTCASAASPKLCAVASPSRVPPCSSSATRPRVLPWCCASVRTISTSCCAKPSSSSKRLLSWCSKSRSSTCCCRAWRAWASGLLRPPSMQCGWRPGHHQPVGVEAQVVGQSHQALQFFDR